MSHGYHLPTFPITEEEACLTVYYPDDPSIRWAIYGQLIALTKWWNWQKSAGTEAKQTADHLIDYFPFRIVEGCEPVTDCNAIETCLETSTIINAMQASIAANGGNIGTLFTQIGEIEDLIEVSDNNVYPPQPTVAEPDQLCDAVYYVFDKVYEFIDSAITALETLNISDIMESALLIGGWSSVDLASLLAFLQTDPSPTLLADVLAARDTVASYLYCNELDRDLTILDVEASPTIGAIPRQAIAGTLKSVTDGKLALWISIGQITDSGEDCSNFCEWEQVFDFRLDDFDEYWEPQFAEYPPVWLGSDGIEGGRDSLGCRGGLRIQFPFDVTLTYLKSTTRHNITAANTRTNGQVITDVGDANILMSNLRSASGFGTFDFINTGFWENSRNIILAFGSRNGAASWTRVETLTIRGLGENPFDSMP